jgi:hypothetical protein
MTEYDPKLIRTIARNFFIRPKAWSHTGMDWSPDNDQWEKLSDQDKIFWYETAKIWLNTWKDQSPELYEYYMNNWIEDFDTDGYNNLISVRPITL